MSSTTAETVDLTPATLLNINMSNVTKLTSTNYMKWSLQVHALLEGYELAGHLDGTTPTLSPTITTEGVETTNPAYALWRRQDRLIFSGLIGSIVVSIQPIVSTAKTAYDIWTTLAATYAKPSRGHIQQLRLQIRQWSKGTKTIDEYIQGLTTRFDQLALLGKPMDHADQIEYILGGLPDDYKQTVDQIESRGATPSITEVHEKFLNREAKLLTAPVSDSPITANTAYTQQHQSQNRQHQTQRQPQTWNRNQQQQRYNNSNNNRYNNSFWFTFSTVQR